MIGLSREELISELVNLGIREEDAIRYVKEIGPDTIHQVLASKVEDKEELLLFISAGFALPYAEKLVEAGFKAIVDIDDIRALRDAGLSIDDIILLKKRNIDISEIIDWPQLYEYRGRVRDLLDMLFKWLDRGIPLKTAKIWTTYGISFDYITEIYRKLDPRTLNRINRDVEHYALEIGYMLRNGVDKSDIADFIKYDVPSDDVVDLYKAGFTKDEIIQLYLKHGIDLSDIAVLLRGFKYGVAKGLSKEQIVTILEVLDVDTFKSLMYYAGKYNLWDIFAYAVDVVDKSRLRYVLETLLRYVEKLVRMQEALEEDLKWEDVPEFKKLGGKMKEFWSLYFYPEEGRKWLEVGIMDPTVARLFNIMGFTPISARLWIDFYKKNFGIDITSKNIKEHVFDIRDLVRRHSDKAYEEDIIAELEKWLKLGVSLKDLGAWYRVVKSADEAEAWFKEGAKTIEDIRDLKALGFKL
jgi:hypothetical protein